MLADSLAHQLVSFLPNLKFSIKTDYRIFSLMLNLSVCLIDMLPKFSTKYSFVIKCCTYKSLNLFFNASIKIF